MCSNSYLWIFLDPLKSISILDLCRLSLIPLTLLCIIKKMVFFCHIKLPFSNYEGQPLICIFLVLVKKDKCVWPCDSSCIVNSCSACLCLLPEIGTVSYLSSRHMMTRVYSFSKYLSRISYILGMVPACGVPEGMRQGHSNNLSC